MEIEAVIAHVRSDLERLVRIPSVSLDLDRPEPLLAAARATAEILRTAGLGDVELLDVEGAPPAVYGAIEAPPGAPTVLLYAHYDVQPAGPLKEWTSAPFDPVERGGRLYGRGTADDKCGVAMHVGLLRAFDGKPPVGVKVIVEGDEDSGRSSFARVLLDQPERFAADVVVIADALNQRSGEPALYTSVRGGAIVDVDVRALRAPVHNGIFGGPVPDALMALTRMLASLHREDGTVAVPGLSGGHWDGEPVEEAWVREGAGMLEGLELIGAGSIADRLYAGPSITTIGIDVPAVETAANALVPAVRARLCARLAPDDDPAAAVERIAAHLRGNAPWGVEVDVRAVQLAAGVRLAHDGPAAVVAQQALADAYRHPVSLQGMGGGNPMLAAFKRAVPEAEFIMWGAADDTSRMHSNDESVDLADLARATVAQIRFVEELVTRW